MTYLYILTKTAEIKDWPHQVTIKIWSKRALRHSDERFMGMENVTTTLENSLAVSEKANIHQPYDPTIPQLDIYPREIETGIHTKTHTQIFMPTLSVINKN